MHGRFGALARSDQEHGKFPVKASQIIAPTLPRHRMAAPHSIRLEPDPVIHLQGMCRNIEKKWDLCLRLRELHCGRRWGSMHAGSRMFPAFENSGSATLPAGTTDIGIFQQVLEPVPVCHVSTQVHFHLLLQG